MRARVFKRSDKDNMLIDLMLPKGKSCFLWGPRKAGKSYWIRHHLKNVALIDLLQTDIFSEYAARPALLRERFGDAKKLSNRESGCVRNAAASFFVGKS